MGSGDAQGPEGVCSFLFTTHLVSTPLCSSSSSSSYSSFSSSSSSSPSSSPFPSSLFSFQSSLPQPPPSSQQ
ncbi:hypothetical protein SprV_0100006200 [Sparganum proliferum]